ncbi:MAG: hypothetical protein FJY07_11910 [Bacteroidetes bacterium]|nr:hypothetical protein [Bacteroidota bacterium]
MSKNKSVKIIAKESEVQYSSIIQTRDSNTITFSTHQKEDEEGLHYRANLTPEERMRYLYELICISYGLNTEKLRNPKLKNIIVIENPDEHFSGIS